MSSELTNKERMVIQYLKWYGELDKIPNIIAKAEDKGILTNAERRQLYSMNIRELLDIDEDKEQIQTNNDIYLVKTKTGTMYRED